MQTASLLFDVADGEALQVRIDPTTGPGKSRLRGSLGGMFVLIGEGLKNAGGEPAGGKALSVLPSPARGLAARRQAWATEEWRLKAYVF